MMFLFRTTVSLLLLALITAAITFAQPAYLSLNRDERLRYEAELNTLSADFHTSILPYNQDEVLKFINIDSLYQTYSFLKQEKWVWRKLRKEHLLELNAPDYAIHVDPLFDFSVGMAQKGGIYQNTRGARINARIGQKFAISSNYVENQSQFPGYLDDFIKGTPSTFPNQVAPGQGKVRKFKGSSYDYGMASGYISYSPGKYFNFQLGHDKNFFGEGYRSLFLSDNAYNYPFLKITTTFWKIKYVALWAEFQDLRIPKNDFDSYNKKYGTFHYLSWNIHKRWSVGFFDCIIWRLRDTLSYRGFDVNYLNPVIFLRPIENSVGSPDNAMLGFWAKYKINNTISAYAQLMLDEFKLKEIRAQKGWWANKQGFQVGLKSYNTAGIKDLYIQTEFNFVRPFMYQHWTSLSCYGHYNQPLAHPQGANFWEWLILTNYRRQNIYGNWKLNIVGYGADSSRTANYGHDIFKSYYTYAQEYGNKVGQGVSSLLVMNEFKAGYLINPKYNMVFEVGLTHRLLRQKSNTTSDFIILAGIKTSIFNKYYDF